MPDCKLCELSHKVSSGNVYCTVTGINPRSCTDCYLCADCLIHVTEKDQLIKIFDPNEKPFYEQIKG